MLILYSTYSLVIRSSLQWISFSLYITLPHKYVHPVFQEARSLPFLWVQPWCPPFLHLYSVTPLLLSVCSSTCLFSRGSGSGGDTEGPWEISWHVLGTLVGGDSRGDRDLNLWVYSEGSPLKFLTKDYKTKEQTFPYTGSVGEVPHRTTRSWATQGFRRWFHLS